MEKVDFDSKALVPLVKTERSCTGEKILQVDVNAVSEVLENPEYKDHYVAIYTIVRPIRTGKSFLFSLLWKFFKQNKEKSDYDQ